MTLLHQFLFSLKCGTEWNTCSYPFRHVGIYMRMLLDRCWYQSYCLVLQLSRLSLMSDRTSICDVAKSSLQIFYIWEDFSVLLSYVRPCKMMPCSVIFRTDENQATLHCIIWYLHVCCWTVRIWDSNTTRYNMSVHDAYIWYAKGRGGLPHLAFKLSAAFRLRSP